MVRQRQRHTLERKLSRILVDHVLDLEILHAVWSKSRQRVAERRLQLRSPLVVIAAL